MLEMVRALWTDEDGFTTVEYALLLALLVVAVIFFCSVTGVFPNKLAPSTAPAS